MKAELFKKLAVVSVDSGAKLGYVEDLLFNTGSLSVSAFRVKAEGQEMLLSLSDIKSIGSDAITVPNDSTMRTTSAASDLDVLPGIDAMEKLKVVDENGNFIGKVKEVDVDPTDGTITGITTHEGGVLGIGGTTSSIAAANIRSIGNEVMIVTVPAPVPDAAEKK